MDQTQLLNPMLITLVAALYGLGMILKHTEMIPDKFIPLILLFVGIIGSVGVLGTNVDACIQGVIATSLAVYSNQIIKQVKVK